MKKIIFNILLCSIVLIAIGSCKKKAPVAVSEAALVLSVDASSIVHNPGSNYSFVTKITSTMPPKGVIINVELKEELSGTQIAQVTGFTTNTPNTPTQITNLPVQKWCICTIKCTSLSLASNTATTSFRIVNK